MSDFQDKNLTCQDCGNSFPFTAEKQEYFASQGWQNEPRRCLDCNKKFKDARGDAAPRAQRQMYPITCSDCGQPGEVPFPPTPGKPVRCKNCFQPRGGR